MKEGLGRKIYHVSISILIFTTDLEDMSVQHVLIHFSAEITGLIDKRMGKGKQADQLCGSKPVVCTVRCCCSV